MKPVGALLLFCAAVPAFAQVSTTPGPDDPRLQTLVQPQGQRARLVVFPEASLTLILRQGERVRQVALSDSSAFHVAITGDNDSISISPLLMPTRRLDSSLLATARNASPTFVRWNRTYNTRHSAARTATSPIVVAVIVVPRTW